MVFLSTKMGQTTLSMIRNTAATIAHGVVLAATRIAMLAATAAQWLFNAAMSANPIGLIILAIAGLIAGIVALVKHWGAVTAALKVVAQWFINIYNAIKERVLKVFDAVVGALKAIGQWFVHVKDVIVDFIKNAINWLKDRLEALIKPFQVVFGWISKLIGHSPGVVMLSDEMQNLGDVLPQKELETFASSALAPNVDQTAQLVDETKDLDDNMKTFAFAVTDAARRLSDQLRPALHTLYDMLKDVVAQTNSLVDALNSIPSEINTAVNVAKSGGGGGGAGEYNLTDLANAPVLSPCGATKTSTVETEQASIAAETPTPSVKPEVKAGTEIPLDVFAKQLAPLITTPLISWSNDITAMQMLGIPNFQSGGVMPYTGLAYVHKGEPIGEGMLSLTVPIYLDGELIDTKIIERVGKKARLRGY
jgi:hypothetical protein